MYYNLNNNKNLFINESNKISKKQIFKDYNKNVNSNIFKYNKNPPFNLDKDNAKKLNLENIEVNQADLIRNKYLYNKWY